MQIYGPDLIGGVNIEQFEDLPPWTSDRTGSVIYVSNTDMFYFANQSGWLALPDVNKLQEEYRKLGGTGVRGGTGATGERGPVGPVGNTGGTGTTGHTGHTGGSGGSGGTGDVGSTGGSGGTGKSGGTGHTGSMGQCKYGNSGGTGGTGTHGLIGTLLGDGDSATLLCMVEVELRGHSGNELGIEIKNVYNSFDIEYTLLSKGQMVNNIVLSPDGTTISIYPDFFATHNVKSTMPNLAFNNSMKEVQIYTNQYFDMKLFHPLDGRYQDITGWLDYGHVIRFQVLYVAAKKICDTLESKNYVDFTAVALDSSFDYPYVDNTTGFGGGGNTFDVQFIPQIPPGFTYDSVTFDFGTTNIIPLSQTSCKYTEVGSYNVTMTILSGLSGDVMIRKNGFINVVSSLDANFTFEFLTDDPGLYPLRVQFHPDTDLGGDHMWYFDSLDNPSFFSADVSPIVTYDEEEKTYQVTHELTIDGRTRAVTKTVTTWFNPDIDFTISLGELDEWDQTIDLYLSDATIPDNTLLTWTWDLHEYDGINPRYSSIQGKDVIVDYNLGVAETYLITVSFTTLGRNSEQFDSELKSVILNIPYIERGMIAGGQCGYHSFNKDDIWVINPTSSADIVLFGSLNRACQSNCGASNGNISNGLIVEGYNRNPSNVDVFYDEIEHYLIKTFSKVSYDFARLNNKTINSAACSNSINDKIIIVGGKSNDSVILSDIEMMTISTGSEHIIFANLSQGIESLSASSNGISNKGFLIGGFNNVAVQSIEIFNFETIGNVSNFATLTTNLIGACAVSNNTNNRILVAGGQNENLTSTPINTIETFNANTISSTTYFGNLYTPKTNVNGFSTGLGNTAIFANGRSAIIDNVNDDNYWEQWNTDVEIVNIVSGANTNLFGNLSDIHGKGTAGSASMSNSF